MFLTKLTFHFHDRCEFSCNRLFKLVKASKIVACTPKCNQTLPETSRSSFGTTLAPFKKTHNFHVLIMKKQKLEEESEQMIDSGAHI